jgi:hypothetical protein
MMSNDRGRFLPIARIHRARETILEQALRAQKEAIYRAEFALASAKQIVVLADARIAAMISNRCEKNATDASELTCFDLRMITARSEREIAISNVSLASEKVKEECEIYRQLMKKLMREHEYVESAMKQHRGETRRHQQKIEIASEEAISDSLRPATSVALYF